MNKRPELFPYAVIAIGIFLRLVWLSDMEWKGDERWMYTKAHEVAVEKKFPEVGMESGGGIVNPGMSVAAFAVIAAFTGDPLEMGRAVQIINVLSILFFLLFILYRVEEKERNVWLMGLALASVSPLAVLFSRKIWAQDLLPMLSFIILFAHANRQKRFGAFVWGLAGALLGQIHMSGFFFAAGLAVFSIAHDYYNRIKFRWAWWIAGSIIGSITILPWISFMLNNPQVTKQSFWHIFQFNFYLYWLLDSLGLNIMYSVRKEFWELIKEPIIGGVPTYLIAIAHLFLVAGGIVLLKKIWSYIKRMVELFRERVFFQKIFTNTPVTWFYLLSILLGLGIFMTLSGTTIFPHYMICAFPFSYIFLSKLLQQNKKLMQGVIVAQLCITVAFMMYVHKNNGVKSGDYGVAYHAQQNTESK
jgi:hypothetical protein